MLAELQSSRLGWRINFQYGSLTCLASWAGLLTRSLDFLPHGHFKGLLKCPYDMAAGLVQKEYSKRNMDEAAMSFVIQNSGFTLHHFCNSCRPAPLHLGDNTHHKYQKIRIFKGPWKLATTGIEVRFFPIHQLFSLICWKRLFSF